jgi:hypothetical protein
MLTSQYGHFSMAHDVYVSSGLWRFSVLILWQEDGTNCSIFSFDVTANKSRLPMARNALKKLRTLRHPGVIKVLDTVEVERRH